MNRHKIWNKALAMTLGAIIGTSVAIFGTMAIYDTTEAHIDPWGHTWPYSLSSANCGGLTEVDPIQIVYYGNATTANVDMHSDHHGYWNSSFGGSDQYYDDHSCAPMSSDNATGNFSRHHQRHRQNYDPDFGTYSLSTPHYEDWVLDCPGHAVRENESASMPEGGFINAKHTIDQAWHNWNQGGGAHHFGGSQDWDNTRRFQQCDGQWAWGNGIVDFIRID